MAVLGETLSEYRFNYEFVNYRKAILSLLTPKGKDSGLFWTSTLIFSCPVPDDAGLREAIADGTSLLSDGTATLHLDVIPIRTSVRYGEQYLTEDQIGPKVSVPAFDPVTRWGPRNVVPRIEASGRWENIPICRPPKPEIKKSIVGKDEHHVKKTDRELDSKDDATNKGERPAKPHYLSACLWASATFNTRGSLGYTNTDTLKRLQEWIEFHLMVGFDHIYVYDNTGAHTNETSMEPLLRDYPSSAVTRIDWPSTVCNNNVPADDSPGERSSQYAAESSCLA